MLAGALLVSCNKKEYSVTESLSLDKETIEAPKNLASYKIGVSSNVSWTVSFVNESGEELLWGILDRKSGSGNATLTLRLYENKYKSERRGQVVVKTQGGLSAAVAVVQEGDSESEKDATSFSLRLGTYNVRTIISESNPNNVWDIRKDRLKQSFTDCEFDVVGLQEVAVDIQKYLTSQFSSTYTFQFFSPYSQNGNGDKAQGIAWRTSKFAMSNWNYFWMGDNPSVMTQNDVGSNGNFKRGGSCCILTHKGTGLKIFIMNTHACLNSEANHTYAPQYEEMEKQFNTESLPSFFVGDMNTSESSTSGTPYMVYTSYWKDSFKLVPADKRNGCTNSYNAFSYPQGKSRIDFVFIRGEKTIALDSYTCNNTLYGGLYASDHFPVYVDAVISN